MNERIVQFRVGVMVLATIIIAAILLVLFGEMPTLGWGRGTYQLLIEFPRAPGVTVDTPVRKNGILIGRVAEVTLPDKGGVLVTVAIYNHIKLRADERCRVKGSLFGDSVLEFVPSGEMREVGYLQDGDRLPDGLVTSDPLDLLSEMEGDIAQTVKTFGQAGRDVSRLTQNLNKMLPSNEKQFENILNETEKALKSFQSAMDGINEVTGDKELRDGLRDSLKTFPKLLTDTRDTIAIIKETATLANENLTNLQGFTKPLNREGERIILRLNSSMDNLDALLTQMVLFSKKLNSDEGSLGQLVKNPDLYQNLTRAAENIEQASRKLRPIMDDARDIADKVNRQGILGSGVLKGSGTKGRAGSQYRTTDHW